MNFQDEFATHGWYPSRDATISSPTTSGQSAVGAPGASREIATALSPRAGSFFIAAAMRGKLGSPLYELSKLPCNKERSNPPSANRTNDAGIARRKRQSFSLGASD